MYGGFNMKIRKNYVTPVHSHTSSFYGVVHHDAKRIEKEWEKIGPKHSMEDYFGMSVRKSPEENKQYDDRTGNP